MMKLTLFALAVFWPTLASGQGYEVWLTDQNNTRGYSGSATRGTHGGRLLIYDGDDLDAESRPTNRPQIIDLGDLFALGSNNTTGANVVRPHMIVPDPHHNFVALAFVGSGHVAIIDGKTKQAKALFRMSAGDAGARQAHAAFWTVDGTALIVANQNGKLLERIVYDSATDTFTHDTAATLNLATCRTPNGFPCQSDTPLSDLVPGYFGPHNRPDNAPICPVVSADNKVFVTLRGGGLFVVDPVSTPMAIVGEFGNSFMGRDGCGGAQSGKTVFLNGGAGTLTTNPSEFNIYRIPDEFPSAPSFLPANFQRNLPRHVAGNASPDRDSHGMAITAGGHYLWQFDRLANVAEIYRLPSGRHAFTVDLTATGVSSDPTPDLVALSPIGNRIYAALRGPKPQTGAHASMGSTPGLGIVNISHGGAYGGLFAILPTEFRNPEDGSEESDPHGICVLLK
jgi:DNA-binding beta-propeller fold protein YncE